MVNLKKKVNLNKRKTSRKVNLSKVYIPAERFIKRFIKVIILLFIDLYLSIYFCSLLPIAQYCSNEFMHF